MDYKLVKVWFENEGNEKNYKNTLNIHCIGWNVCIPSCSSDQYAQENFLSCRLFVDGVDD